jgi:transcriptional regulator with XRE-family HTH domain
MSKERTGERNLKPRLGDAGDAAVGPRIRALRNSLGLSQVDLAKRLGVSFQQVQKYENSRNRVSVGRLDHIANVLGVSVTFLLTGTEEMRGQRGDDEAATLINIPGALRLIKVFNRMENPKVRQAFVTLVESAASKSRR